jgi:hypothetical protein
MSRIVVMGVVGVVVVSFGLGCATPAPTIPAEQAFGPSASAAPPARVSQKPKASPEKWAQGFRRPGECEAAARDLETTTSHEVAWSYLKGCVSRPDFGLLPALLDNWSADLKSRPEGASILAQVIACRGGSVGTDLQLVQQRRLPLFELSAALQQPKAFKGRYVLFVGRVQRIRDHRGQTEVILAERARVSDQATVFAGAMHGHASGSSSSGSSSFRSTGMMGSGSAEAQGSRSSFSQSGNVELRVTADFEDTGQEIQARLAQSDPFLAVDRSFVFLVRFDGAKKSDASDEEIEEEPAMVALVSLVSYHDVNASGVISR